MRALFLPTLYSELQSKDLTSSGYRFGLFWISAEPEVTA